MGVVKGEVFMPELPEVETIRLGLEKLVIEKKLSGLEILCEKSFKGDKDILIGQKIVGLERRGKALLIEWSNGRWLMIHLRMTGQLIFVDGDERFAAGHPDEGFCEEMPNRKTRVVFVFSDGSHLFFNDQRKFGFCSVLTQDELREDKFLKKLAPEPWAMAEGELFERLQKHRKTTIKAAILDQTVIAGVGNIYADESLYAAGIWPAQKVEDLTRTEIDGLWKEIIRIMRLAIESGGSTMKDYVRADGTRGDYLDKFAQVFRREGRVCGRCGGVILKTKVAGRGTHYCPNCQKAKG